MKVLDFAKWVSGTIVGGVPETFSGVAIDSRILEEGMMFTALRTDRRDGHDFVESTIKNGAALALVEKEWLLKNADKKLPLIAVDNPAKALAVGAHNYAKTFKGMLGAVTGSCGKTTTKEFLAAFLRAGGKTASTKGNLNNDLGLPLSILNSPLDIDYGIFECGTNHHGEIAFLRDILNPHFAVITCIGTAHLEFFKTREGIAKEKGSLLEKLPENGFAVLDADGDFFEFLKNINPSRTVSVSAKDKTSDYFWVVVEESTGCIQIKEKNGKEIILRSGLPGVHNALDMVLAYAAARECGVSMGKCSGALSDFSLPGARWRRCNRNGVQWIDDSYNANPGSMAVALETFGKLKSDGRKIAVLGDMGELGGESARHHAEVGKMAVKCGADIVVGVGKTTVENMLPEIAKCGIETIACMNAQEAKAQLDNIQKVGDIILLKASHGMMLGDILK